MIAPNSSSGSTLTPGAANRSIVQLRFPNPRETPPPSGEEGEDEQLASILNPFSSPSKQSNTTVDPSSPPADAFDEDLEDVDEAGKGNTLPSSSAYHVEDLRRDELLQEPMTSSRAQAAESQSGGGTVDLRRDLCDQNLFVFHLPSEWNERDLSGRFCEFGEILSARVVKRPDGSSKGYGFVCFKNRDEAVAAMENMNGYSIGGKRLKVSMKKTPEECLQLQVEKLMRMSISGSPSFDTERDCSLFVFHLPPSWDDAELKQRFQRFGTIVAAKVSRKDDNTSRGYGFVTCADPKSAALAILHLNGFQVGNKRLKVQLKQSPTPTHPKLPDATVFVFHLPNEWSDANLKQFFQSAGHVVSATVQRDPKGRSRGFGFVSFDRPQSARTAVSQFNGVSVGVKRLKVSLKRSSPGGSFADSTGPIIASGGAPLRRRGLPAAAEVGRPPSALTTTASGSGNTTIMRNHRGKHQPATGPTRSGEERDVYSLALKLTDSTSTGPSYYGTPAGGAASYAYNCGGGDPSYLQQPSAADYSRAAALYPFTQHHVGLRDVGVRPDGSGGLLYEDEDARGGSGPPAREYLQQQPRQMYMGPVAEYVERRALYERNPFQYAPGGEAGGTTSAYPARFTETGAPDNPPPPWQQGGGHINF